MGQKIKKLPESELEAMLVVWEMQPPAAGTRISEELARRKGWSKSTVFTLLLRLSEKGYLRCEKEGKNNYYCPLVTQDEYRAAESRSVLDRFYAGSMKNFLAAFCDESAIDEKELEELRAFIDERTKGD